MPELPAGVRLRVMRPSDIEPARWVIYRAYLEVLLRLYGPGAGAQYAVRARRFMEMYLERDPAGCIVAEAGDGTVVGTVFGFAWREVGWFGSLAVAPERQGQGIGQGLTRRIVEYLRGRGCRRIGLETWTGSPVVRHLYEKLGFVALRSTMKLSRDPQVAPVATAWSCEWLDQHRAAGLAPALAAVEDITLRLSQAAAEPLPDYRLEVAVPIRAGWAELALLFDAARRPQAVALCYVKKPSGEATEALDLRLLLVAPGPHATDALDALLAACDRRALALGLAALTCDVNLRYAAAASLLRERGFQPVYELLRMELPLAGYDPMRRSPAIECVRWVG